MIEFKPLHKDDLQLLYRWFQEPTINSNSFKKCTRDVFCVYIEEPQSIDFHFSIMPTSRVLRNEYQLSIQFFLG